MQETFKPSFIPKENPICEICRGAHKTSQHGEVEKKINVESKYIKEIHKKDNREK